MTARSTGRTGSRVKPPGRQCSPSGVTRSQVSGCGGGMGRIVPRLYLCTAPRRSSLAHDAMQPAPPSRVRRVRWRNGPPEHEPRAPLASGHRWGSCTRWRMDVERRQPPTADEAPVMIWRAGADRSVDYVNRAWLDFTGRSLEEELGFGWTARVHPEDLARLLALYAAAFAERRELSAEYRLCRWDGSWRWMLDRGRPCYEGDVFVGFVGACTDMTLALEERQRSTAEQEYLLTELNHRVKNNAQTTASFLTLQANRAADPD